MPGTLYIVSTPIGNLEDITVRALRILRDVVDAIACEDTRQTVKLLEHYEFRKPLISYHEHNEASRSAELVERLQQGDSIALVSDAGTPLVSDPGFRLVTAAISAGIPVVPVPGPSAALTALAGSGLPTDEFRFIGFVPQKTGARRRLLENLANDRTTVVLYESPHRVIETLADIAQIMGARPIVLARELTKLHEEFLRGSAEEIRNELLSRGSVKGEITLLLAPAGEQAIAADPVAEVARLQSEEGLDRMEA
ncbi:MAG: 16S rRNA (cytidine(1402)-2'-O)-methyltransferase, partial [Acidobacteriaceae bacterium]|nr:16S rRNA (cytidine(1402)-2'-O)-methyltransferase [Acidobacteriaceae bacterium]